MKPDTRLLLFYLGLFVAFAGGLALLLFFPFVQAPQAVLPDGVLLEYGTRQTGTGDTTVVRVLSDGTIFQFTKNTTVGVLTADELAELKNAIAGGNYSADRRSLWSTLMLARCGNCKDHWVVVRALTNDSVRIVDLAAPKALMRISSGP